MKTLCRYSFFIFLLTGWFSAPIEAQTATVISDTEAAQHVGQQTTVEGTVVKGVHQQKRQYIYSGAIDEGNRTKQKLLIETGRIFYWDTQHYRLCKVISIGAYGICQLQDVFAKKVAYSSAAFLHRAILSQ
jgi:hypothetical protein